MWCFLQFRTFTFKSCGHYVFSSAVLCSSAGCMHVCQLPDGILSVFDMEGEEFEEHFVSLAYNSCIVWEADKLSLSW